MPLLSLPVLDTLLERALTSEDYKSLDDTIVIYVHHALYSSLSLLNTIIRLGILPQHIFVLGKHYSECKTVVDDAKKLGVYYQLCSTQKKLGNFSANFTEDVNLLWAFVLTNLKHRKDIRNIIIMDHGGYMLASVPIQLIDTYNIIGIEKTTAGLNNFDSQKSTFPIIETASCAAKKILESPLIAEAIVNKLIPLIPINNIDLVCGVLGYGSIGAAVTNKLISMGHNVIVYDKDKKIIEYSDNINVASTSDELIIIADYIFGCSGVCSIASINDIITSAKDKTFISCSSEDVEFSSILQFIQESTHQNKVVTSANDIIYHTDSGAVIRILKSGFPINFDHSGESVPANDIQLTRALVFVTLLQAIRFLKGMTILKRGEQYMLDPYLQKQVVNEWLKYQPVDRFSVEIIQSFQNESWVIDHSKGIYQPLSALLS